jgi:hypothetical protein
MPGNVYYVAPGSSKTVGPPLILSEVMRALAAFATVP